MIYYLALTTPSNMKSTIPIAIASLLTVCLLSCQEQEPVYIYGNIAGKVTEEGTNLPIEGATVELSGVEQSVKTGSSGMFKFETLPADNYTIYVSKEGYVADSKIITVVAKQTSQSDFSLVKNLPVVSPTELVLSTEVSSATLELKNTRSGEMNYTIQVSKPWIKVTPMNGTILSMNSKLLSVELDFTGINYGNYNESILINVGQSSVSIPVQITYVRPSYIDVTSPTGSTTYDMGSVLQISWDSNISGPVKIELLRNGSVQQAIAAAVENNNGGNYNWSIPSLDEDGYQIKVTSNEFNSVSGTSQTFHLKIAPTPPRVLTGSVEVINSTSISIKGILLDLGKTFSSVSQYGHVYSKSNPEPTISDYLTSYGPTSQTLTYISEITNLIPNTTYYIRAYAINDKGIAYGNVVSTSTATANGEEPWALTEPDADGAVDLGLSVKWAAYNVGASCAEEYGKYYAWAETTDKIDYSTSTYSFYGPISGYGSFYSYSYPGGLTCIAGTQYDAATVNMKNGWRMPTRLEMIELTVNCQVVATTLNGVTGVRAIGPNGNCIFLPAAGCKNESGFYSTPGTDGFYWSADANYTGYEGYSYYHGWAYFLITGTYKGKGSWSVAEAIPEVYCGFSVRAVHDK